MRRDPAIPRDIAAPEDRSSTVTAPTVSRLGVAPRTRCGSSWSQAIVGHDNVKEAELTTLIVWTGIDSHGPASIYLAADSQFTFPRGSKWSFGRKVYASRLVPDVLGYCGDVLFATQALSQALEQIEAQLLFDRHSDFSGKLTALREFVSQCFETYPADERHPFSLVYATRDGNGMCSKFSVGKIDWSHADGWNTQTLPLPTNSGVVLAAGSGRTPYMSTLTRWQNSDIGGTSRAVFSAFCDHIKSGADAATGGAPQLVGLYRDSRPARTFGVFWNEKMFLSGAEVVAPHRASDTECRDELFQLCDPLTGDLVGGAQRHARPGGL